MNRRLAAMMTSKTGVYGTPPDFYAWLDRIFAFTIDLAALPHNAKHPRFYSPAQNSLMQSWEGETGYLNCPYGRSVGQWQAKTRDEAMYERALVVQLLPSRVDTDWWQTYVMSRDGAAGKLLRSEYVPKTGVLWLRWEALVTGIYHHDERLPFEGMENGAPFPSSVVIHAHPSRRTTAKSSEPQDIDLTLGWPR